MADLVRRPARPTVRRARQLDRGPRVEYLAFSLAGEAYAAPVSLIREILKPPALTPVPRAPRAILGIISVRGQLITVIDLRRRLQLADNPATPRSRILLADGADGEILGLFVDDVIQVCRLAESEIESAVPALGGEVAGYITGIARPVLSRVETPGKGDHLTTIRVGSDDVIILIDLRAVLGRDRPAI
jgi:purine-binding chemotaxis protein CheW